MSAHHPKHGGAAGRHRRTAAKDAAKGQHRPPHPIDGRRRRITRASVLAGAAVGTLLAFAPAANAGVSTATTSNVVTVSSTAHGTAGGNAVVAEASRYAGKPYVFGAAGPRAYDCSGLTMTVYRRFGVHLPHSANLQQRYGRPVPRSQLRPGDLMVFVRGGHGYHVAIYAGDGMMWEAANPRKPVGKHRVWSNSYVVRRLVG